MSSLFISAFMLASLPACDGGSAVKFEIYRSNARDGELELIGAGCIARTSDGGAGGGTNEYVQRQEATANGGIRLTYLVLETATGPEHPIEDSEPELEVGAVVELSKSDLASGEVFVDEFDRADGVHFELLHWGSASCD